MRLASAAYAGVVTHTRVAPRRHHLRYRIFQVLFDLDELYELDRSLRLFSNEGFNLFGFRAADHGRGGGDLRAHVQETLAQAGLPAPARIQLLCMPRLLGFVFNPLSIYYCLDQSDRLTAALYEVNNTFGERHSYLVPLDDAGARTFHHAADKDFFVSPFMDMEMRYEFQLGRPGRAISTKVAGLSRAGEPLIHTAFAGERVELCDRALLRLAATHPMMTLGAVAAIHLEAARLFGKGLRLRSRAPERGHRISHAFPQTETQPL